VTYDELQASLAAAQTDLATQIRVRDTASALATSAQGRVRDLSTQLEAYKPSSTDQALLKERDAGKSALIDYLKANPNATEAAAIAQWNTSALTGRPADRQWLLQDPASIRKEYSANLVGMGYVADTTWAAFAAFVVATPKATLMVL
jgi:hypothetical protein